MTYLDGRSLSPGKIAIIVGVVLALVAGGIVGIVALNSFSRTDGGTVMVVRNDGPLDSTDIRQVLPPNSSRTYTGMFSDEHPYPAGPRFYDVVPLGDDRPGVNAYRTPTKDGVDVGITARLNFTLNTTDASMRQFDDLYGVRTYAVPGTDQRLAPWDGDLGWSNWLDVMLKPVLEETLRQQLASVDCADLQASCALVQNNTGKVDPAAVAAAGTNPQTIAEIQTNVQKALGENVKRALGGDFLVNVSFSLTGVDLPQKLRDAITTAQTAFAGASEAQAALNRAKLDADAQVEKQRGYAACGACQQVDVLKAQGDAWSRMPQGTVWAPGNSDIVSVPVPR